ncbi:MAG TPA: hypothetical protein VMF03_06480 [Steroidobacteraceae bacterium]|nr:hypothetical protein [Steroidobacteraceae bacterium]
MRILSALIAALALPVTAQALDAGAIRGGWVSEGGPTQVYLLIVRGDVVTGTHCVDCARPQNLGFIEGRIDADGAHFAIRHDAAGRTTVDEVRGVVKDGELVLTVQRRGAGAQPRTLTLHRPARPAAAGPPPGPRPRVEYVLPGPAQPLTPGKLLGLWLFGGGPGKQYFIIRQADDKLLGMVCGPCDNPWSMAPLDGFEIHGTDLRFNIVHEDTGGADVHGPFSNVAHATLARNELHLKVIPSYAPPDTTPIEMTLLGPVTFRP